MWLQLSQRPHSISVVKMSRGGRKLYGTEALALVLGYLRSSWDHYYRLLGSRLKYLKDLFYIDECSLHCDPNNSNTFNYLEGSIYEIRVHLVLYFQ